MTTTTRATDVLRRAALILAASALAACAPGEGQVEVTAWGETRALEPLHTVDGWTVQFDAWVTAFRDLRFTDPKTDAVVAQDPTPRVVDLTRTLQPAPLTTFTLPAERLDFGFTVSPPSADAQQGSDVDPDLVQAMADAGWSTWISGQATAGDQRKTFAWGLDLPSRYDTCVNGADGTAGIAVRADALTQAGITAHVDHALWAALGTEEAPLRFQALADADADADGQITADELAAVATVDIGYETSGLADDLYSMIAYSVAISAHLNGEGLCVVRSL